MFIEFDVSDFNVLGFFIGGQGFPDFNFKFSSHSLFLSLQSLIVSFLSIFKSLLSSLNLLSHFSSDLLNLLSHDALSSSDLFDFDHAQHLMNHLSCLLDLSQLSELSLLGVFD